MKLDLTVRLTEANARDVTSHQPIAAFSHLGTHIDVMGCDFSLENFSRAGKLIDVSSVREREIVVDDFGGVLFEENDFALIYTGFIDRVPYGSHEYFKNHPELSLQSIELLLQKKVSLIGIDAPGLRRGPDHPKVDRLCAEKNVFVVENLVNLDKLVNVPRGQSIIVYTSPFNMAGLTGLPCRVIAEF